MWWQLGSLHPILDSQGKILFYSVQAVFVYIDMFHHEKARPIMPGTLCFSFVPVDSAPGPNGEMGSFPNS
jgi:hypothetical protein